MIVNKIITSLNIGLDRGILYLYYKFIEVDDDDIEDRISSRILSFSSLNSSGSIRGFSSVFFYVVIPILYMCKIAINGISGMIILFIMASPLFFCDYKRYRVHFTKMRLSKKNAYTIISCIIAVALIIGPFIYKKLLP